MARLIKNAMAENLTVSIPVSVWRTYYVVELASTETRYLPFDSEIIEDDCGYDTDPVDLINEKLNNNIDNLNIQLDKEYPGAKIIDFTIDEDNNSLDLTVTAATTAENYKAFFMGQVSRNKILSDLVYPVLYKNDDGEIEITGRLAINEPVREDYDIDI